MIIIKPHYKQLLADSIKIFAFAGFVYLLLYVLRLVEVDEYIPVILWKETIAIIVAILLMLIRYIHLTTVKWEINNETILRTKGVFAKKKDYIELYRIVDYQETQTFLQRIFHVKDITVISTDRSDQIMRIFGVPQSEDIIRKIRTLVERIKKEKRVYEITNY